LEQKIHFVEAKKYIKTRLFAEKASKNLLNLDKNRLEKSTDYLPFLSMSFNRRETNRHEQSHIEIWNV
jgi:hypothetical protein